MDWGGNKTDRGVTERDFAVRSKDRSVPGVLWTPEDATGSTPLVLIGHGGNGHKREDHLVALARRFVRHNAIAAVTIDGPIHGDREPEEIRGAPFEERSKHFVGDRVTDDMIEDWKATLDALQKLPEIGPGHVGYWGLSMGTMFGLPLVASEPRIEVAVLGLMGRLGKDERLHNDAPRISCPVLFLQQWDDELIPRDRSSALFAAIGSAQKSLHANPGLHSAVPKEEFLNTQNFLAGHLLAKND
jgi:dienelactone hydrolase